MSDPKNKDKSPEALSHETSRDWKSFIPTLLRAKTRERKDFYYEDEKLDYEKNRDLDRFGSNINLNRWR